MPGGPYACLSASRLCRWEAGQRLARKLLLQLYESATAAKASSADKQALRSTLAGAGGVPESLVGAFKAVLTDKVRAVVWWAGRRVVVRDRGGQWGACLCAHARIGVCLLCLHRIEEGWGRKHASVLKAWMC